MQRLALLCGPGLMVMLADTDAGSIMTAAQGGAVWGYRLLLPQILLIPVLIGVQEMTVRLGVVTGKGHGALIREHFGIAWGMLSVGTLYLSCLGALLTEFAGVAGVSDLFGVPRWESVGLAALFLIALVITGSYTRVERVGIAIGALELLFVPAAILTHPHSTSIVQDLASLPLTQHSYIVLLAANVGAVIMPWMVFYQQGAIIDKGVTRQHLRMARWDTVLGAIITQLIMAAVVVATAATIGQTHPGMPLTTVGAIAHGLVPFLTWDQARLLFGLGLAGAAFVAALVVSVAGAWGISEVFGWRCSLNDPASRAWTFYGLYSLAVLAGALAVIVRTDLINLAVAIEVMNAILLPVVLGFLLALEAITLPERDRMRGLWKYGVWAMTGSVIALGLYMAGTMVIL